MRNDQPTDQMIILDMQIGHLIDHQLQNEPECGENEPKYDRLTSFFIR